MDNLNVKIKEEYRSLYGRLASDRKKYIHPKSTQNIIYHLIDNPKVSKKKNSNLQELGNVRTKERLLEFFTVIGNMESELNNQMATDLYKRYYFKIGSFMSSNYGFTAFGGGSILIPMIAILIFGAIVDSIVYFLFSLFPVFTMLFFVLLITRYYLKSKAKKVYGLFY